MSEQRGALNPRAIAPQLPGGAGPEPAAAPEPVAAPEAGLVGQLLDGRYQVLQPLGEGMLTTVYEARHSGSGRHFAIKVLRAGLAAKPHILDRFLQQARAAAQLRHDHVVTIEEFGYTPTRSVYAAVELVVADTLQTILDRDGRWSWTQARPVALQVAAALAAAHGAGLVHRALKPANCFVVLDPKGKRDPFVKVADFGLAQVGVEANQASPDATTTTIYGDPEYMAPEQGFGGQATPQSDIYAFGVLLYRMLAGRVPFTGPNPFQTISHHAQKPVPPLREADPRIPEPVEQLVLACLAKAPEQRPASAGQLEQAIAAIPAHAQGGGHAPPPAAAPQAGGPRFARMNAGGAGPGPTAVPPKQPSVIVAGSLGDGSGGISGTLGDGGDPQAGPYAASSPSQVPPPALVVPPAPVGSSATLAPPPMLTPPAAAGGAPSSFLASRPGLRMGLGAAVPGSDGPAPPPTIAPGMAVPSPTIAPGSSPFTFGSDFGAPGYDPGPPGYPPPLGAEPSVAGPPPLGAGPGMPPPLGAGPGMPPPGVGPGMPPPGAGSGIPPLGAGPGMPPLGAGPGMPPPGAGPGIPPLGAGPGMPPPGAGPGIPPLGAGPGMPPPGAGPGIPPLGAGPGMPPLSAGPGIPPVGGGPGMPSPGAGPGIPPIGAGSGIPPLSQGRGIPPVGAAAPGAGSGIPPLSQGRGIPPVNAGMPPAGAGPGYPPLGAGPGIPPIGGGPGMPGAGVGRSGGAGIPPIEDAQHGAASSLPAAAPGGLGAVEYDEEDQPKRRAWLFVVIGVAVILGGVGLALLIAAGLEDPEGDVAQVMRAQRAQDVSDEEPEPKPEPEPEPEPELPLIEPPKVPKKPPPKKVGPTFEQSLSQLKGKIRAQCKKFGKGPIDIDTFVDKAGGKANTPKVTPKNPVGDCALRIVKSWDFPASDDDHPIAERVSW